MRYTTYEFELAPFVHNDNVSKAPFKNIAGLEGGYSERQGYKRTAKRHDTRGEAMHQE